MRAHALRQGSLEGTTDCGAGDTLPGVVRLTATRLCIASAKGVGVAQCATKADGLRGRMAWTGPGPEPGQPTRKPAEAEHLLSAERHILTAGQW